MTQAVAPEISEAVKKVVAGYPKQAQSKFSAVRQIIYEEAARLDVGPIEETLKWGEPAYLTSKSKAGSTIRLAWSPKRAGTFGLFFNCQTNLVSRLSADFPSEFAYDKNRVAAIDLNDELPEFAARSAVAMALNYHRDRASAKQGS